MSRLDSVASTVYPTGTFRPLEKQAIDPCRDAVESAAANLKAENHLHCKVVCHRPYRAADGNKDSSSISVIGCRSLLTAQ
jgi:hypothetical protein